jgi:hypothetical protein
MRLTIGFRFRCIPLKLSVHVENVRYVTDTLMIKYRLCDSPLAGRKKTVETVSFSNRNSPG